MAKKQQNIGKIKKAHIKQLTKKELKQQKSEAARERQDVRDKRSNKEQLVLLDSKGWKAEKERNRLNATS